MLVAMAGCNSEQAVEKDSPLATVEEFIKVYYFGEGTYADYEKLFANPEDIRAEEDFDQYREDTEPQDLFPSGYESVEAVMGHLEVEEVDENTVRVHYYEDIEQQEGKSFFWTLVKVDDQWLLSW